MLPEREGQVKLVSSNGGWEALTEALPASGQTSALAEAPHEVAAATLSVT